MRLHLLFLTLCGLLAGAPAFAEQAPPSEAITPKSVGELSLDQLFEKLPGNAGSRGGRLIEGEILERFSKSGSDTADLLMSWSVQAIDEKNYPLALDILDQVVILKPDFTEAWNKRATVHYLRDDYASSLADIRNTLALEPRHFGALSGLGLILEETGRKDQAVAVFRRALALNPQLENVKKSLERLEKETAGDSI